MDIKLEYAGNFSFNGFHGTRIVLYVNNEVYFKGIIKERYTKVWYLINELKEFKAIYAYNTVKTDKKYFFNLLTFHTYKFIINTLDNTIENLDLVYNPNNNKELSCIYNKNIYKLIFKPGFTSGLEYQFNLLKNEEQIAYLKREDYTFSWSAKQVYHGYCDEEINIDFFLDHV